VGHTLWSTAQARYGRPLRVSGVQFPPPPLKVNVERYTSQILPIEPRSQIVAVANLAQTVYNGVSFTNATNPQTEMWFLLYAQVPRVDGQARRNILYPEKVLGIPPDKAAVNPGQIQVIGWFQQSKIEIWLTSLQLPKTTPTSVLAVELFNGEVNVIPPNTSPRRQKDAVQSDPLGSELGTRRILRVSPLTAVRVACPSDL